MTVSRILRSAFCAALLGLAFTIPSQVQASDCGYGTCWGAIAVGERGIAARASGHRTAPDAHARAERVCNGNCAAIEVFHSGCGAIVQSGPSARFAGFAATRDLAILDATAQCEGAGKQSCRVRIWACSQ